MKDFDSLFNEIASTKILNFFGYRLTATTNKYNTYSKIDSSNLFYLFNDLDSDSLQIFSGTQYRKISKTELFSQISTATTLSLALKQIEEIVQSAPLDSNANINSSIAVSSLVNLIASLVELDAQILPITQTPQFKNKVFLTQDGFYKTPLFLFHLHQASSNRIINYVKWNDSQTIYMNQTSYCLNATHYLPDNKYMFITSSPVSWITFPTLHHSPDYFQLLCHPSGSSELCALVYNIYSKFSFSKCSLHLKNNFHDNAFTCKLLSFFINQHLKFKFNYFIEFSGTRYIINISYWNSRDSNIEIAKLFSQLTYQIRENYFEGQHDTIELGEALEKQISVESNKTQVGEWVTVSESFTANTVHSVQFFNTLIKILHLEKHLEIIEL